MYKVFIYDKPVLITKNQDFDQKFSTFIETGSVGELLQEIEQEDVLGIVVVTSDPKSFFKKIKNTFKYIKAAGGVVYNSQNEVLFIHRIGKWDLPKGKLEKGENIEECAVREVEEECNVDGLLIVKELPSTYHCYYHKEKWVLKRTYWYEMRTNYNGELIPQTEEGIEAVEWLAKEDWGKVLDNTYKSIVEVLNA